MKATGQKLKKLKTKQLYGFKKDSINGKAGVDETTSVLTTTHIMLAGLNYN